MRNKKRAIIRRDCTKIAIDHAMFGFAAGLMDFFLSTDICNTQFSINMNCPDDRTLHFTDMLSSENFINATSPMSQPVTSVYDSFCNENADGLSYCQTSGRCYDPKRQVCLESAFAEADGLPSCLKSALGICQKKYLGKSEEACIHGSIQSQRAPLLITASETSSKHLRPEAFAWGHEIASELCSFTR
jgi:hypothetical protein